jgi:dTDP-4-amino-4,6-dideoxygalactose transaminase
MRTVRINMSLEELRPNQPVYVTKPNLPPLVDFIPYLQQIWESKILTNEGPLVKLFEEELCRYLGVGHISIFSNATLALITAIKALDLQGEVITTPFSFVATSHSLLWNNLKPIFVDIDETTLNINPDIIEKAISPQTSAILAVHCYGNPCLVDKIQSIADKHNLRVIYDAAHAFGVKCHCDNLLLSGDLSVLSFHATKVFNTFEGGAIICKNQEVKHKLDILKNFGIQDEDNISGLGLNAKMNEMQAAIGLLQLRLVDGYIEKRSLLADRYNQALSSLDYIKNVDFSRASRQNHSYYPILVHENAKSISREVICKALCKQNIFPRRYFYPLISNLPLYSNMPSSSPENLVIANRVANEILCLPIYPDLATEEQEVIISSIASVAENMN